MIPSIVSQSQSQSDTHTPTNKSNYDSSVICRVHFSTLPNIQYTNNNSRSTLLGHMDWLVSNLPTSPIFEPYHVDEHNNEDAWLLITRLLQTTPDKAKYITWIKTRCPDTPRYHSRRFLPRGAVEQTEIGRFFWPKE